MRAGPATSMLRGIRKAQERSFQRLRAAVTAEAKILRRQIEAQREGDPRAQPPIHVVRRASLNFVRARSQSRRKLAYSNPVKKGRRREQEALPQPWRTVHEHRGNAVDFAATATPDNGARPVNPGLRGFRVAQPDDADDDDDGPAGLPLSLGSSKVSRPVMAMRQMSLRKLRLLQARFKHGKVAAQMVPSRNSRKSHPTSEGQHSEAWIWGRPGASLHF